jgi:hypothetical protein
MRLARLVSIASFALVSVVAACGDDGGTTFIDASVPDAVPPPPDAEPFVCSGTTPDDCDGVCVNLDTSEATCGDCDTSCTGGQYCNGGTCECPPAFVSASPSFVFQQTDSSQIPNTTIGFGVFSNGGGHVLAVAYSTTPTTPIDTPITLDADPLTMPLLGAGYNVDVQSQTFDSAFAATAGTITFDTICAEGFSGTATDVTFSGVDSLTNPVIIPGGCTFDVASVTFSYGTACPP